MEISILEAFKVLDETAEKCLLIIDKNKKLLGTITDGDLRRAILNGKKFSEPIKNCCNRNLFPLIIDLIMINLLLSYWLIRTYAYTRYKSKTEVVDYITWSNFKDGYKDKNKTLLRYSCLNYSRRKGSRLKPFTKILPKPLIPINEVPILEHITNQFTAYGISKFYISVNYKSKIIKAYFEDLNPSYEVSFIEEKKPLGTIGSLHYLDGIINQPCFISNCDILIKSDYEKILNHHRDGKYDLTLVVSAKEHTIPYGTCELNNDGSLLRITEKPKFDFLINTGFYIINQDIISYIPKDEFYHITDLIEELSKKGKNWCFSRK